MTWLDLADNPEAVKSTFETAPSLKNVEVFSVLIDREGPTITVEIALNEAPSKPSPRWERINANAVTLKLQMLGVESVTLEGWATDNKATIDIHPGSSTKIEVCISGPTTQFKCCCQWLHIAALSGYRKESHLPESSRG